MALDQMRQYCYIDTEVNTPNADNSKVHDQKWKCLNAYVVSDCILC